MLKTSTYDAKNTSKTFYTKLLAYESNKEYLYEYETQALTGIPMGSTIYSGMKMKSDVRIDPVPVPLVRYLEGK